MIRNTLALALATTAALLVAPAANATVFYNVVGSFEADTDSDTINEIYNWSFDYSSASFVTSFSNVTPSSCSISGTFYVCSAQQTLDPSASSFPPGVNADYIGFNVDNADLSGGGTGFYWFQLGALGAVGIYSNAGHPDPGSGYGNAGPATLTVRSDAIGAVPEPASWALMLGGFGLVGAAMRRRTQEHVTYA
jgi:opacity protein-like surface antigen